MARTYRKVVKCGICTGSNTNYYRAMNRKCRAKNNHSLRNLMAHYDIETVNDLIMNETPIHNDWDEPTDGTILITKKNKNDYKYVNGSIVENPHYGTGENYWNHKYGKYLKNRHYKH